MKKNISVSLFLVLSFSIIFVFNIPVGAEDKITFIHRWPNQPFKGFFDYAVEQFQEQNPNVIFDVLSYLDGEYKQKINMFLTSENPPDIFFMRAGNMSNKFIREGQALDLTQYYEKDTNWSDKIISSAVKPFTSDNRVYGIPVTMNVRMLAYNKEIFEELNLEVPETWNEFIQVLKILKNGGYIPLGYSNNTPLPGGLYITALNQRILGLETVREDYSSPGDFSEAGYLEALKRIESLIPYMNEHPNFINRAQEREMFKDGEIAIITLHAQEISYLKDMEHRWDIFDFPEIKEGKGDSDVVIGAPEGFMISQESENPVIAMEFLKFITSQEMSKVWVEMTNVISTTEGAVNKDNSHPVMIEIINELRKAEDVSLWLDIAADSEISQSYLKGIQEIINREKTAEQIMEEIRESTEELRKETE